MTKKLPHSSQIGTALKGHVAAPGDKSMSHRALIFGAMAEGETRIHGLLEGADILSTADAMRAFGATIHKDTDGSWVVKGVGTRGFTSPAAPVDCGNAGTGVRLIMGAAAGYNVTATFTGDASLSSRPMARVLNPLEEMGVQTTATHGDRLPITMTSSGELTPIDYTPPHASAQVKSCVLLAAVNTEGTTTLRESRLTRDHTENMLEAFGVTVERRPIDAGQIVRITGPAPLTGTQVTVPGDPSSAAFLIVAALITPGSEVTIENVMMNPSRTGLFETLSEMGGYIRTDNFRKSGGEVIADIFVQHSRLQGITVPPHRAPAMIDEYPILAVAAAFAKGQTIMNGISELRVKESDRIAATVALLKSNGVEVVEREDGMTVIGQSGTSVAGGATVKTHHDHRIAMSALILGLNANAPIHIDDSAMIGTSFPTFFELMTELGATFA